MRLCIFRRVTSGRQNCRLSNFHLNKRVNWTPRVIFTQSARSWEKERRMNKKRIREEMIELSSRDFVYYERIDAQCVDWWFGRKEIYAIVQFLPFNITFFIRENYSEL